MSRRLPFFAAFFACGALLGYGYYLEHVQGLAPCPLCILQRVAFAAVGVVALVAALHGPLGWAARGYAFLGLAGALAGAGLAGRQIYLQQLPPDAVPACGPGLDYLLEVFPLREALSQALRGSGECAELLPWSFLGLGIPEWALAWFALLALLLAAVFIRPARA